MLRVSLFFVFGSILLLFLIGLCVGCGILVMSWECVFV